MRLKNPRLEIDLKKIRANAKNVLDTCKPAGVSVMGVTKSFCAFLPVVQAFVESGITQLADSRLQNIINMKQSGVQAEFMLLRIPMMSEVEELVTYAQMSVNSELEVIEAINNAAGKQKKIHKIMLAVDVGDLREGFWPDQVVEAARACAKMENIELAGLFTNFGCYGGVLPTVKNTSILVELAQQIEEEIGSPLQYVSVGGTVAFKLLEDGIMPKGINHIRIGEAITMGMDTSGMERKINGAFQDAFELVAEIIELKEKPSVPIGDIGYDAFTGIPKFEDKGIRRRAICGIGKQDLFLEALYPKCPGVEVLGASSDHLLLDVTDSPERLRVGDEVRFGITWSNMLRLTTSPYVQKIAVE